MAKDLTVILEDRPGTIADLGEALGKAGINIDAVCGMPCEGRGVIHVIVEDAVEARRVLEGGSFQVTDEREVLILEVENRPGSLGEIARKIANAGVNIDLLYIASNNRLVVGVDNLEGARAVV